jgi:3-oxoacyl-[acyl-carrier-protein] synthase-1
MMRAIFVAADNMLSPLGSTTKENFDQLKKTVSGIRKHHNGAISPDPFYASLIAEEKIPLLRENLTRFERMLITSAEDALKQSDVDPADPKTIFILSSTKGNISLLESEQLTPALEDRISLYRSGRRVRDYFKAANEPVIVSHACISGLLAIITGMRMLQSGRYERAVIIGADTISRFVLSGFQSFQAISAEPCKPFDAARNGITLGEAAATIILSTENNNKEAIQVCGGSVSNDANHISGPSRTGEELHQSIQRALKEAGVSGQEIDFISAHGTATLYNDEMEAKAINLSGLQDIPVNSLKGYYGHTLGASGLIESIVSIQSLKENLFLPTLGFKNQGTSLPIAVSNQFQKGSYKKCLKTASGFGGCNAAVVISKE